MAAFFRSCVASSSCSYTVSVLRATRGNDALHLVLEQLTIGSKLCRGLLRRFSIAFCMVLDNRMKEHIQ